MNKEIDDYNKELEAMDNDPYCMFTSVGIIPQLKKDDEVLVYFSPKKQLFLCDESWKAKEQIFGDKMEILDTYKKSGWVKYFDYGKR